MSGLLRSNLLHGALGFVAMGGWAVFANRAHAMPAPLLAGLVQGVLTTAITLIMKRVVETICARLSGAPGHVLPPLAAGAISLSLLSSLHWLAGTPEILATITVPLIVGTSYAALYAAALQRGNRK